MTMTIDELRTALAAQSFSVTDGIEHLRMLFDAQSKLLPIREGVKIERTTLGGLPAERHIPFGDAVGSMLYLHGGGYCIGSLRSVRPLAANLAAEASIEVITLDYRLAPENPFPAALDDALAAFDELLAEGVVPERLAVGGDSAGGGLAVAALIAIRDSGRPAPAAGLCISPWVDLEMPGASLEINDEFDPMVNRGLLEWLAMMYAGDSPLSDPRVSPARAELSSLPPLLVHAGEYECLRDDAVAFVEAARSAGADVDSAVWPDMIHVWHMFAPELSAANDALNAAGRWLNGKLEN